MDAPEDYNRHRFRETWGERHDRTPKEERRLERRREVRQRNRMPGQFGKANWEAYQHYELYNMIMKANPRQMYERAEAWKELANRIEATTAQAQDVVTRVMGSWQGQAAVNAGASTSRLMQWAGTASHTSATVAENMSSYSDAVASAQRNMPPPGFATAERRFRDGYTVMTTGGPADAVFLKQLTSDGMVSHSEARARKAEAVAVMEEYESHSRNVHTAMPHFEDAQEMPKDAPEWTPRPVDGGSGGGSGSGFPPGSGPGAGVPGGNSSTTPSSFAPPATTGPGGPGGGFPPGTTGFGPGSLNGNGGADALRGGGFGAGFGPGFGGAGAGASSGAAGPLAGRGPGGGVIGGPGGVVPGANGARGGAGALGGMPFGAGANGEEDGEHTNKYDEGLDLFDDLPPAYPPVFGA